jgi:chromosome segregation ATPase
MPCAKKALLILMVATVGIWGCAQSTTPSSTSDRLKALELKNAKLEDDFRAAAAVRDQLRRRVVSLENEQAQLQNHFQALERERDALRLQLAERSAERDAILAHFDQFRNGLKDLIVQTEAALPRSSNSAFTNVNAEEGNQ